MKIRTVKTASGKIAVQAVRYEGKRTVVLKHIGSAKNNEEVCLLKQLAQQWITQFTGQESLFPLEEAKRDTLLGKYKYLGFRYGLVYELINNIFKMFRFDSLGGKHEKIFLDLCLIRAVQPASKRESQELLKSLFGIDYDLTEIYRSLVEFPKLQNEIEEKLTAFAKSHLGFDFNFVLYDITTLYFETFSEDDFRRTGFSKDNKIGQPQILIGLIVNKEGFPLSFAVFNGNKFEGHTLIPIISEFKSKHKISTLTVVADAAMISRDNIIGLKQAGLSYIVGARLGYLNQSTISKISQDLSAVDGACLRLTTDEGFLICSFSAKRYIKDKHEMDKQLEKAKKILDGKRESKRNKFLGCNAKNRYFLKTSLIEKTKLLLGIKGYHTDLSCSEKVIIERYADLWNIERAFRISKNDLNIRPVYHFKKQAILAHVLICTVALAVLKFMEIQTGKSAKYIMGAFKSVTDGRILNTITGKESYLRSEIPDEIQEILQKMKLPH